MMVMAGRGQMGAVMAQGRGGGAVPSTLDTFTAANNTNINGRTPDTGKSGVTWSVASGTILIQANLAASSGTAIAVIDCGRSDGTLTLTNARWATAGGSYVSVYFRWQDANNHWRLTLSPERGAGVSDWFLQSYSGGVATTQAQGELNFATSSVHTITIALSGNSIVAGVDGTQIASISNSHLAAAQMHGFGFIGNAGQYVDSFNFAAA